MEDKDTLLMVKLENALKTARYFELKYNTEQKTVIEKYTPKWIKVLAWFGAAFIIITILFLVRKFV